LNVKIRMLAGVACAALMAFALPAEAATIPQLPGPVSADTGDAAVASFYASRLCTSLWL
jgi:hypothetical protein